MRFAISSLFVCFLMSVGCTTARVTDTARTGNEQLLISNAVDQTLDKLPLPDVQGRKVFVDSQFMDSVDKGYVISSIRQRLLAGGALLKDKKEDSEITIEVSSGAVGTDSVDSYMGMPALMIPAPIPVNLPEVRVVQRKSRYGTAKLNLVAYSTTDGSLVFDSGRALARSNDSAWSVMGVGPIHRGTVRDELKLAEESSTSLPTSTRAVPPGPAAHSAHVNVSDEPTVNR